MACFGAQNPSGTGALPAGMPPQQCFAVVGCATHQGSQRACGDGRTDANAQRDRDIAMLVLEQRFDHGQTGRRTQDFHVVPAQLVASDPGNDPSQWNSHPVRVVGYGPNGGCPETGVPGTFGPLRSVGGTSVRYGNVPLADITATIDLWAAVSMGGDSGGAVFVDRPDEDGPLQLLAVNTYTYFAALSPCPPYADGVDAHDRGTRVTYADVQSFLARFLGQRFLAPPPPPSMPAVAGELVCQAGVPALWLGDVNVAPVGEPERVGFVDPATGLAADVFDPDGDGLAGAADNCWGIRNDDQRLGDPTNPSLASCVRPSSGATVSYGCDPATSSAPGALETSIDPDGDRIPTPCDMCPWVRDFDQRDRNGNGIGDACRCGDPRVPPGAPCDVDTDGDEYPDDVDNCAGVPNADQRDCNADAEIHVPGAAVLGDACDTTPCVTTVIESDTGRGDASAIVIDRVRGDPTGTSPGSFRTGFRFCPCSVASDNSSTSRDRCESFNVSDRSGGCEIANPALFLLPTTPPLERADFRRVTLSPGSVDSVGRVDLVHDLPIVFTFDSGWDITRTDAPRWETAFPTFYPASTSPSPPARGTPIHGVFWSLTLGPTAGTPFGGDPARLASSYFSGPIADTFALVGTPPPREPFVPFLPLPMDNGFCVFCGDQLPIPWAVLPCLDRRCTGLDPTDPSIALRDALVRPSVAPAFHPPGLELLGGLGTARWAAAPEPFALDDAAALRFVALDASSALPVRLLTGAGSLASFGKGGCPPEQQCFQFPLTSAATVDAAGKESPPERSDFALAVSATRACAWIVGGRTSGGAELHDVWLYGATNASWQPLIFTGVALGRVRALAYAADEQALYLLDEIDAGRRASVRLVRAAAFGGAAVVVGTWPRSRVSDAVVLAADGRAHLWLGASNGGAHAVTRLSRDARDRWLADGFRASPGALERDGAYANVRGLSIAVRRADGRSEIVGYDARDLVPRGGPERCF